MAFVPIVAVVCPSHPVVNNRFKEITSKVLFSRSIILNTPQFRFYFYINLGRETLYLTVLFCV